MDISTVNGPMAGQRPPAPPPQAGGKGGPSFEEVLQSKDADSDNSLNIDEIDISEEAFAKADLNEDGIIDESEFESGGNRIIGDDLHAQMSEGMQSQMWPPPGGMQQGGMQSRMELPPSFEELLQNKDADSDDSLSIDEIDISEEVFATADLNKDGIIDKSEFESGGDRIIGDDLYAQMSEGMQSQMGPPPPLSGQGNSMYGQYGTELKNGIDLIA